MGSFLTVAAGLAAGSLGEAGRTLTLLREQREERCRRYGHPACVVSIDLNDLKIVNDTHGHAAGDDLLRRSGEALRSAVRQQDVAARLGGLPRPFPSGACDNLCRSC